MDSRFCERSVLYSELILGVFCVHCSILQLPDNSYVVELGQERRRIGAKNDQEAVRAGLALAGEMVFGGFGCSLLGDVTRVGNWL